MPGSTPQDGERAPKPLDAELVLARAADAFTSATIVLVDDDPSNVRLLTTVLGMAGATDVHGVTDPAEATALCRRLRADLLLLDLHMGQVDGHDLLTELRPEIEAHLAVVVLSGDTSPHTRKRVLVAGAKDFVPKPFDLPELVRRVRLVLEERSHRVSLR